MAASGRDRARLPGSWVESAAPTTETPDATIARSALDTLTALPLRHPLLVLGCAIGALAMAALAFVRMRLDPDVESILGGPSAATFQKIAESFGWRERASLLLEVSAPSPGEDRSGDLVALAEAIAAGAESEPGLLDVRFGLGAAAAGQSSGAATRELLFPYGLLLLDDPKQVATLLSEAGMVTRLEEQLERISLPGLGDQDVFVEHDPLGLQLLLAPRFESLKGGLRFAPGEPHFLSVDRNALLVVATGRHQPGLSDPVVLAKALDRAIDRGVQALGPRAEGLAVHRTGNAYFTEETQRIIAGDLSISLTASILLAMAMLAVAFRMGIVQVGLLILPTMWGAAVGLGIFVALQDQVSLLSFACAAILIGLGIDFTIHVTTAALQERGKGRSAAGALLRAMRETRGRLALAAITSASAFLAFLTADAAFLQDMGLLTALGLGTCLLSPFVVLPPILLPVLRRASPSRAVGTAPFRITRMCGALAGRPRLTLGGTAVVCAAATLWMVLEPPRLEDDLRNLHSADSVPLAVQARLQQRFGGSLEPLLLLIETEEEGQVLTAAADTSARLAPLKEQGVFQGVVSIANLVPAPQKQQATLAVLGGVSREETAHRLRRALDTVGFDPAEFEDYVTGFAEAAAQKAPVLPSDLVRAGGSLADLATRFVQPSPEGGHHGMVLLEPADSLWDGDRRDQLLQATRDAIPALGSGGTASPKAPVSIGLTGTLPTAAESAEMVAGTFGQVALLTLAAVLVVLAIRFRRPGRVLLVLVPAAVGTLLSASLLSVLGIRLNLMNMGVVPMVLALGIDDGIHMVAHGLGGIASGGTRRRVRTEDLLGATGTGILLTSLTTMVTFGSLAYSANQGLASVGILSFAGIGICLVASLITVPALLQWRGHTTSGGTDSHGTGSRRTGDPGTGAGG